MSVFGGDSWGREAQHRKRRVENLVAEEAIDESSSLKRLSNGKFACLLCPQNPVLDTLLMFFTHCKGSRHRAAESRLKERELARRDGANKRAALAGSFHGSAANPNARTTAIGHEREALSQKHEIRGNDGSGSSFPGARTSREAVARGDSECRERQERELKLMAAGWKRDCHGGWYEDENVEFDSDEEDPNICLR